MLLALRVAALLLLAVSFARPYLASTTLAADAAVTVVAVDTSLSLSAAAAVRAGEGTGDRGRSRRARFASGGADGLW